MVNILERLKFTLDHKSLRLTRLSRDDIAQHKIDIIWIPGFYRNHHSELKQVLKDCEKRFRKAFQWQAKNRSRN